MTINCKGQLIDFEIPKVMGILNVTPNSFFDGGKYRSDLQILEIVEKMITEGASFIDVGGYSSKPNAEMISDSEELQRVIPTIELILKNFPTTIISVDTFRSQVAQKSIEAGAAMINDISAGNLDSEMFQTVADLKVPYIMMHMRGTPQTMQKLTSYEDIIKEILFYFSERIFVAKSYGITDILIDPGFGFAKTLSQNYEILKKLELFQMIELPLLVGASRKSMTYQPLGTSSDQALNATTVINTIALTKGANILRVHDVKEAVESVKLYELSK